MKMERTTRLMRSVWLKKGLWRDIEKASGGFFKWWMDLFLMTDKWMGGLNKVLMGEDEWQWPWVMVTRQGFPVSHEEAEEALGGRWWWMKAPLCIFHYQRCPIFMVMIVFRNPCVFFPPFSCTFCQCARGCCERCSCQDRLKRPEEWRQVKSDVWEKKEPLAGFSWLNLVSFYAVKSWQIVKRCMKFWRGFKE